MWDEIVSFNIAAHSLLGMEGKDRFFTSPNKKKGCERGIAELVGRAVVLSWPTSVGCLEKGKKEDPKSDNGSDCFQSSRNMKDDRI